MAKTPSGLKITRNKNKFTAEWTPCKGFDDGQELEYTVIWSTRTGTTKTPLGTTMEIWAQGGKAVTDLIGKNTKKKAISVDTKGCFPENRKKKLVGVRVRVRGYKDDKKKRTWSGWASKTFTIKDPKKPKFSAVPAPLDSNDDRKSTFTVSAVSADDKGATPVTQLVWESILVKNAPSTDGKQYAWTSMQTGWRTGTVKTLSNYVVPIPTETIVPTFSESWTRFVRVKAEGLGGDSEWAYCYHVYAKPKTPRVGEDDGELAEDGSAGLVIDASWDTPSDPSKPIDKIKLQYAIVEPAEGLNCPAQPSWTDAQITGDTKAQDKAFYEVGQNLNRDQCLFYRVLAVHDNETSPSLPVLKYVGFLKDPTGLSVQVNWTTRKATVTATNASGIDDSFLAIVCNDSSHVIGRIPHGMTSATVDLPPSATEGKFAIGVQAVVGVWDGNGVVPYDGKPIMRSKNTLWQGGTVPVAPSNVGVEKTTVDGTVRVSWDWSWEDADSAQIAWSDNPLAWESTDEPSDYTITNLNPSHWYVSDLALGQIWYFRVRLLQTNDDAVTYGAWSDMVSINLSSAPNKPTLFLSDGVISANSMTKAYWAYVSTDSTPQAYADICEATISGSGVEYGEPILHTEEEQHIDIYPDRLGWSDGEMHNLCVRVVSGSGMVSDGWSEPVPLQIAAEMTCEITEDSLETQSIEVNPETHSGNPITFTNPDGVLEFAKLRVDLEPTQDGTGDPSPSNVRPIHGVGEVDVTDTNGEDTQTFTQTLTTTLQPIASDDEPYLMRAMPFSDATNLTESLVGGTVAWNQLCNSSSVTVPNGHKYYMIKGGTASIGASTGTAITGLTSGTDIVTDLTAMFNPQVADAIYTMEQATAGAGVAWFKKLFNKAYYPYNKGELMSVKTSAHVTKDADENVIGNYPLSPIDLRGVPKWVDGKLKFDGDVYEPSGTVTRRYGYVDLGSLNWRAESAWGTGTFRTDDVTNAKSHIPSVLINMINAKGYKQIGAMSASDPSGVIVLNSTQHGPNTLAIKDTAYTDATAFKTAMSGVYLVYELATATTETVSSFESNQLVSAGGTESYTDTRTVPIPVGHKSTYKTSHVYGGYVDLITGELVVDRAVVGLDGGENWALDSKYDSFNRFYIENSDIKKYYNYTSHMICNECEIAYGYASYANVVGDFAVTGYTIMSNNWNYLYIAHKTIATVEALKTYLSQHPLQVVYELATPIRTTLSSRELSALVGRNTLTANGNMQIRLAEGITETECLTRLPLTVTVEGAGEGGVTILAIERAEDFHLERPDDSDHRGYIGETVALLSHSGDGDFTITADDITVGHLDDEADYNIVATVQDSYGQSATTEKTFRVAWEHQALMPDGTVTINGDAAYITPAAVSGSVEGDHIDIYRLSADDPELIYSGADFGQTYVDPYPAIGGGYRLVYVTKDGDYKTADGEFAWVDIESGYTNDRMILDFGGDSVELAYNIEDDTGWEKDFKLTRYMGGSIAGDWNPGIVRKTDITATTVSIMDDGMTDEAMVRLGNHEGHVHVRTVDGSSFNADVQIKRNRTYGSISKTSKYSLKITRVDPEGFEAVPIERYEVE